LSFRRKLMLMFALTVIVSVTAVAWLVSMITRQAFEKANEERASALAAQFQREFNRRGDDILRRVEAIAASDAVTRIAMAQGTANRGTFANEAGPIAQSHQLEFLELVDGDGMIVSSAQSPAKFGYPDSSLTDLAKLATKPAFPKLEELNDGSTLGLFAVRPVNIGDKPLYVVGGQRVDRKFLAGLELQAGTRAMLYPSLGSRFSSQAIIDPSGNLKDGDKLASVIGDSLRRGAEQRALLHWSDDPADDESIDAIPLNGADGKPLGVLLVGTARRPYVDVKRHIQSAAMLVGGSSIVLAILLSSWVAARVTKPVEQLAVAAREVASGNLETSVEVTSNDEVGDLAEAFNRMTHELLAQKDRLVQTERVAAWRELARRLAHELKNPLFPLQLTVENLVKARAQSPALFEEIFQESAETLLTEINNLKQVISRFSEFSKMPLPHWQKIEINDVVKNVARLFQPQLESRAGGSIECRLDLGANLPAIAADPELLHRVISNLVLNAMDAMPKEGTLTLRTRQIGDRVVLDVSDTGVGLTAEECARLFTPYYTSKQHGTGLGLAIVQSVTSDHGGRVSVESQPGRGTTFRIELPRNLDKLQAAVEQVPQVLTRGQ
jgi:signal transduction histidine kinase